MNEDHWQLVARDRACQAIADALGAGDSLVVTGPAGVGRTRLAREALRRAGHLQRPTLWAVGTAAAARVPLGALAHLFPVSDGTSDPLALLQRAARAVAGGGSEPSPVLCVDDVHLVDPLSMSLLHHLAVSGVVTLVLTTRTDTATPDPTTPFWKDGLATRLEVRPLSRPDLDRLAAHVLEGDVETRTSEAFWRLCQGRPLYFRELVDDGLRTGRLRASGGLWRWHGAMTPSERLANIVLAHIGDLSAPEATALEVVATAETITVSQAIELGGRDAFVALERCGLISVDDSARPARAHVTQPLYADVVRARASEAAAQLIRSRLTDRRAEAVSREELLLHCAWATDDGSSGLDPPQLAAAARRANAMLDHALAERLARAGVQAGGGAEAYLALMEAVHWQGRSAVGDHFTAEAARLAVTDQHRARLAASRALVLFCGAGDGEEATTLLDQAAAGVHAEDAQAVVGAAGAVLSFLGGNPARAVERATSVLSTSSADSVARPLAAAAAAAGLAVTGETEQALETVRTGWEALDAQPDAVEPAFARTTLAQAEILALLLSGRLSRLEQRATELYRRNLKAPEWAGDAVACLHRGWAALARGRPRPAVRWLNEALVGFDDRDPTGLRPLCVALLTMAKALAGDIAGARELLGDGDGDAKPGPAIRVFEPQDRLAQAWVAAAEERRAEAGRLALDAAELAAGQGQWAVEAAMLHNALSFGRAAEVAGRLRALAGRLDSPLAVHFAAFAEAAGAGSAERLEAVSRAFEDGDALLPASDAAAHAAAAYERAGDRRAAAALTARAVALAREGGLAETPALHNLSPPDLTAREGQVARLAARGLSNLEIAHRLVLSVRTVEAHLAHVYSKLGIRGRPGLSGALELTDPQRTTTRGEDEVPVVGRREQLPLG